MPDDESEPVGILRLEEQRGASGGCETGAGGPGGLGKLLVSPSAVRGEKARAGAEVERYGDGPVQGAEADERAESAGHLSEAFCAEDD